jgi:hypothetical protein
MTFNTMSAITNYCQGGKNIVFTIKSLKTLISYMFKIFYSAKTNLYHVGVSFDDGKTFVHILSIKSNVIVDIQGRSIDKNAPAYIAFKWFFDNMLRKVDVTKHVEFIPYGCTRCGKKLTSIKSLTNGICPKCSKH